jgi:hypothetical protein
VGSPAGNVLSHAAPLGIPRLEGGPRWVPVLAWVFVYWAAAMIDGSFDVYIGGPQGGIWFWAVMGLGIAAIQLSAEQPDVDPLDLESAAARVAT